MLFYSILLAALVGSTSALLGIGRTQSAGVQGVLMCDNSPAANTKVKLYDDNVGLDTLLAEGTTDSQGRFQLQGSTPDITTMDPKLNIYSDCDDDLPCQRKLSVAIPSSYVSSGSTPSQIYNAGTLQLAGTWSGETRDCLN